MAEETKQDIITRMADKFNKVRQILVDHDQLSTKNEPYKYKYEAIEVLKEIEDELSAQLATNDEQTDQIQLTLSVTHLNLGLLYADTAELKAGEEQFVKCLELLKEKKTDPNAILPILSVLNQLGIIWSQWSQPLKAKTYLEEAERIYNDYTNNADGTPEPIHMSMVFGIEETNEDLTPRELLEKLHTLTLYYLAQVYGVLKDQHKSAVYCHMTLRRQLGDTYITEDLDYVDWALNAATLSQYFMENNGVSQARHHLAAATYILKRYEAVLKDKYESPDKEKSETAAADWEHFNHRSADVARCWAKYGILLLTVSKERLLEEVESESGKETKDESQPIADLKFELLAKDIQPIAEQVTDKYLLDFDDARLVFLNVQKWLDQAKNYYALDSHASDHVSIIQDISQAYKYLAFFQEHEDKQAKMHKRRIVLLESVLKELNPQYYKSVCRQLWIELGDIYSDILNIKLDRLRVSNDQPTAHALAKINHLAKSAIHYFETYLKSVETRKANGELEHLSEDVVTPTLMVQFQIGRLYNKIITLDKKTELQNLENSINAYRYIIDYCQKFPKVGELMQVELNLCGKLLKLLPMKADRIREEIQNQ